MTSNDQIHKLLLQSPNCSVSFHYCCNGSLYPINELNDKRHIDGGEKHCMHSLEYLMFQTSGFVLEGVPAGGGGDCMLSLLLAQGYFPLMNTLTHQG